MSEIPDKLYISRFSNAAVFRSKGGVPNMWWVTASLTKDLPTDIEYIPAPQWISVEERLPEIFSGHANAQLVLYRGVDSKYLRYGVGYLWEEGWRVNDDLVIVTHWMPMPALPEAQDWLCS